MRVLIVDDHALFRDSLRSLLEARDYEVVGEAGDGEEGISMAWETKPDVVLMDIQMPVMDGVAATQKIRSLGGAVGSLPIIAMTAHAMHGDREKYLSVGMNDYVTKPIDRTVLLNAITRCASGQTAYAESAAGGSEQSPGSDRSLRDDELLDGTNY